MARNSSTSAPSARTTSATHLPGLGLLEQRGEQQRRAARRRCCPTTDDEVVDHVHAVELAADRPRDPLARRHDGGRGDVARGDPGRLQRRVPRLHAEGHVADLAELLVPDLRALLTRRAPAFDELVGDARRAEELGEDRTGRVVADHEGGGRVAARGFVAAARQPGPHVGARPRASCRDRSGPAGARRPRSAPTHRGRTPAPTTGAATRRGSRWRSSCRRTPGSVVANSNCDGLRSRSRSASRAASTAMVVESSSKRRDGAGALAAALPDEGRDLGAVEPPVGQVGGPGEDSTHGLQRTGPRGDLTRRQTGARDLTPSGGAGTLHAQLARRRKGWTCDSERWPTRTRRSTASRSTGCASSRSSRCRRCRTRRSCSPDSAPTS